MSSMCGRRIKVVPQGNGQVIKEGVESLKESARQGVEALKGAAAQWRSVGRNVVGLHDVDFAVDKGDLNHRQVG